jgi:glutaredoxin
MKYIYTAENCPKCEILKKKYRAEGVRFAERNADRIKQPEDEIDREALVQASMQNMELPVEVDM